MEEEDFMHSMHTIIKKSENITLDHEVYTLMGPSPYTYIQRISAANNCPEVFSKWSPCGEACLERLG